MAIWSIGLVLWVPAAPAQVSGDGASEAPKMTAEELELGENRSARLKYPIEMPIPLELKALLIKDPKARYLVKVDEAGQVIEAICLEATHYGLVEPGLSRVLRAEFDPALQLGIPVAVTGEVTVYFFDPEQRIWQSGGVDNAIPFGNDVTAGVERRLYNAAKDTFIYGKSSMRELDDLLVVLGGSLIVLEDEAGNKAKGECVIEFYVGPDGKVYFPRVVGSDDDLVSKSVIMTLKGIQYKPPTVDGRKTYVQVRQTFRYKD